MRKNLLAGVCVVLFSLLYPVYGTCQVDLTKGLVAFYPFNGNAKDASGNGNDGIPQNGVALTSDKSGNVNSAYSFDGIDDYITIPSSALLNPSNTLSIAFLFNPARNGMQTLIGKINYTQGVATQFQVAMDFTSYPGILFGVNPSAQGCAGVPLNGSYVNTVNAVTPDQWYCVVATFDNGIQKIYLNGVLIQTANAGFTALNQCSNADIQIGRWWSGDLQTFQGKIDEIRIYNRALTQDDVNAFCTLQACPILQGRLSGSNTCNGAPGLLTFHSQSGPGPFTLVYSDGVNSYTQNSVMDSVPFPVQVQPTATTTYTLVSIANNSLCPATPVTGIVTAVNVGNCTLCKGSLGDPVVNVNFGTGAGPAPALPVVAPGASTTLSFIPVSGNPAQPTPVDGWYTITNNVPTNGAWFAGARNHTPNDPNGNMIFYNAGEIPGEFFRQTVTNLCSSTTYEFASWIANAVNPAVLNGIKPDLTFIVQTLDGTVLSAYNSGAISEFSSFTWQQYGFFFTLPAGVSAVVLRMIDNNVGGNTQPGNDFAIDDITFRACGPTSVSSFASATEVDSTGVCEGTTGISLYGTLSPGYSTPNYLWQVSSDNGVTWTDIPNSNTLQLSVNPPVTGLQKKYKYRMQSGDGIKINSANCRVVSNELILSVTPNPTGDFSFVQDVCNPAQVSFTGISQPGVTYIWNMDGSDHSPATPGSSSFVYVFNPFGTYPVTMKITGSGCQNSVTKTIAVLLEPADIISTPDTTICVGTGAVLRTHPSIEFCWNPTLYLDNPSSATPVASPPVATKYYFTAKVTAANLIVNGDFETGNTGFTSAYQNSNSGYPEAVYLVGKSPHDWNMNNPVNCGDHTTGSGNMMIVNGGTISNVIIWTERISVTPNTNYAFSTWVQSVYPVAPAILQFSINGTPLGNAITASSNTCQWNQFYTTWNSGNNSTATISLVNQNTAAFGNDFALDDISFAQLTVQIDSVTIAVETPSVQATPVPDTTVCPGMPVPLHATGSMNYAWSPAASLSDASIADPVALPPSTTGYTVTGTSARGCVATDNITVNIYPRLLSIAPDTTICLGDAAQLYASGGHPYSWSPAGYLDDPMIAAPVAHTNINTRFYVTATDINQCRETDSVLVSIRPVPLFRQPPNETVCLGDSVKLESANGPQYIYSWSPARGLDDPSAPYPAASPGTPTAYTLNIRDSVCATYKDQFFVSVIVRPLPVISIGKANDINCSMPTARLTAAGGVSYTWMPASGLSDPLAASPLASIDSTTTFIVKGLGVNGCSALDTVTVTVSATGSNTFVVPNAFTPNGDGHNDCFGIRRWGDVQLEEFSVYNRWGLQVFTTRNPSDCWDGRYRGKLQVTGGYAYVIRAHSFCGEITHTGVVMLIR